MAVTLMKHSIFKPLEGIEARKLGGIKSEVSREMTSLASSSLSPFVPRLWTLLLVACLVLAGCIDETVKVTIDGEPFTMELALDEEARKTGMSYRDSFPEGGGMLFVFPEPEILSFWMYDCLMDIDVIFLNRHGVVTAVHRMKQEPPRGVDETEVQYIRRLPSYSSYRPAQFAIELPGSTLDRLNVRVDDRIDLDLDRLKAMAE